MFAIRIAFVAIVALAVGMGLATVLMAVFGATFPAGLFGPVYGLSGGEAWLAGGVALVGMVAVFTSAADAMERSR